MEYQFVYFVVLEGRCRQMNHIDDKKHCIQKRRFSFDIGEIKIYCEIVLPVGGIRKFRCDSSTGIDHIVYTVPKRQV